MVGLLGKDSSSKKLTIRKAIKFIKPKLMAKSVVETVWLKGNRCMKIKELAFRNLLMKECSIIRVEKLSNRIIKEM